jgi:two-component system, sensor histidine kinase PdtaS
MFKSLLIICIAFCSTSPSNGQLKGEKPIKEMLVALQSSLPDTTKIQLLLNVSHYYLFTPEFSNKRIDSALFFIQQAKKLSDSIKSEKWRYESVGYLGKYHFKKGDFKQGKSCLMDIINDLANSGKTEAELKWLLELEKNIPIADTIGMTRIDCLTRIIFLYKKLKNEEECMATELKIADVYFNKDLLSIAENKIKKVLENFNTLKGHSFNNANYLLSVINRYKGNLNKALEYSIICVQNVEKNHDSNRVDYFYGELALVYDDLGLKEKSIEWYRKTLNIRKKISLPFVVYRTAGFLIQQLIKQQKSKEAFNLMKSLSIEIPPKTEFDKINLIQIKANYYNALRQYDKAEKYYMEMIQLDWFKVNTQLASIAYGEIGAFYLATHQYVKAKEYLNKSLQGGIGNATLSRLKDLHHKLFEVDSSTGNYISAINHLNQYQAFNDSIFNEIKSKQIEELKIHYETEKKDQVINANMQNIHLLTTQAGLQKAKLQYAATLKNITLAAIALLIIIIGLLYNRYRLKQKTNKKLQIQQKEIQTKNISLQHLVQEKDWLVKEIHHRVKNNLHTIIGLLHTQSEFLKTSEALLAINDSQHRIQTMSLIHEKLFQSGDLSTIEMSGYIRDLVDYLKHSFATGQRILFKLDTEELELKLSHSLPIGLILNEAITNAIKYAFPANSNGTITVSLKHLTNQQYLLSIADNGKGLPTDFDLEKSSSMGMSLMQGLSEDMHGGFSIKNNNGTEINILFLYDSSVADDLMLQEDDHSTETT